MPQVKCAHPSVTYNRPEKTWNCNFCGTLVDIEQWQKQKFENQSEKLKEHENLQSGSNK